MRSWLASANRESPGLLEVPLDMTRFSRGTGGAGGTNIQLLMPYTRAKALERHRPEEEREDVLDALAIGRHRSRRVRLLLQLVEIDEALDGRYNADAAAKDFHRLLWNTRISNELNFVTLFAFTEEQIEEIAKAWRAKPIDQGGIGEHWPNFRLPARYKRPAFTWKLR